MAANLRFAREFRDHRFLAWPFSAAAG